MTLSKRRTVDASRGQDETFTVAIYDAEEGGYWAEVLELPGCASQGETLDELRENIIDAISAVLEVHAEDGERPHARAVTTMSVRVPLSA